MRLPNARGPISAALIDSLAGPPRSLPDELDTLVAALADSSEDTRADGDVQISLFACYGLHYGTFADVDDRWEWHPSILALRAGLEAVFERDSVAGVDVPNDLTADSLPAYLMDIASQGANATLPNYIHYRSTLAQICELVVHRSIDNLHEGDAHTWAIPRIMGRAKSALVEIQADEYGGGMPGRTHAELYATMMSELGLDPTYGAYIEDVLPEAIAIHNLKTLFGLHKRWRGALLGNLAVTEIGSSYTNRRYSEALQRLGATERARLFYDEHILADAVHEQLAAYDMCGSFALDYPGEVDRVVIGAQATLHMRGLFADQVTAAWAENEPTLRSPSRT